MSIFNIAGQYLPAEQAVISVQDLSVLRGYGVFDFMRTYGGRPFHLDDHIQRLSASAAQLEMELPCSKADVAAIVHETLKRNDYPEANVRIVITGGISPDSITPPEKSQLLVLVLPLSPCPAQWYQEGAAVIILNSRRHMPQAKSLNYSSAIISLRQAKRQNAIEAIYTDDDGGLLEGTTSNFFVFKGDNLITPNTGVLSGITRKVVLDLADKEFPISFDTIRLGEVSDISEAFITASNKEVVPIVRIDDRMVGDGQPGKRTRKIMKLFADYTRAYGEDKLSD